MMTAHMHVLFIIYGCKKSIPTLIDGLPYIEAVTPGSQNSFFLDTDGSVCSILRSCSLPRSGRRCLGIMMNNVSNIIAFKNTLYVANNNHSVEIIEAAKIMILGELPLRTSINIACRRTKKRLNSRSF